MSRGLALAVFGGTALVVVLLRPGAAEQAARSPLAWLTAGVVFVFVALIRAGVRRVAGPRAGLLAGIAVGVAALVLLVGPSFRQRTLVEPFPDALSATASLEPSPGAARPSPAPRASTETTSPSPGSRTAPAPDSSPRSTTRLAPPATRAVLSPVPTVQPASSPIPRSQPASKAPEPTAPSAEPSPAYQRVSEGELRGINHSASGQIVLYRGTDGGLIRFQDVAIEGSVKPSVHLVPRGERRPTNGVRLGPLKAERGSFSYPVPATVDLTRDWTVLVWCDPYDTPIAAADLS